MIISEALKSSSIYPVPAKQIEKICIERGLLISDTFDATVAVSESFKLAEADLYMFLFIAPSVGEQEISISMGDRENCRVKANLVYKEYDDPKFNGTNYGFVGEDLNG